MLRKQKDTIDYLFLLFIQGANFLVPLIIMPYLMKVLGAGSFGIVGFSQAVISYFLLIIDFGFNLSATKRIATHLNNKDKINLIFSATLKAKVLLLLISSLCLFLLIVTGVFSEYNIGLLCSIPTIIGSTFTFIWLYQGIGKIKLISLMTILSRILILPLIFIFVKDSSDYEKAILIQSSVFLFTGILSVSYIIKNKIVIITKVSYKQVLYEIRDSFPLFLSSASITVYTRLFILILGLISTPIVVGKYSAAEKIMRAMVVLFLIPLTQLFYPRIAQLAVTNKKEALILLKRIFRVGISLMFLVFLVLFFGADYLYLFLGSDYEGITTLLKIFSFAPFFILIGGVMGQLGLLAIGDASCKKAYKNTYYLSALLSLLILSTLTYLYKELGIALTVVITEAIIAAQMYFKFNKYCFSNKLNIK